MARWIAAGFGSGWLPKAPGTWGSLISLAPGYLLLLSLGSWGLIFASAACLLVGCIACARVLPTIADHDPGWIVIDEWAGQWVCMGLASFVIGNPWLLLACSFLAFRILDIFKPWPVSLLERMGPAWWSIMADDMGAGIIGGLIIFFLEKWAG